MKILQVPNPILRKKTKKIEKITPEIKELAKKMLSLLKGKRVALAANQVGILERIIVLKYAPKVPAKSSTEHLGGPATNSQKANLGGDQPIPETVLINPEIVWQSKETVIHEEGCLSFMEPEIRAEVKRAKKVEVKALNLNGKEIILKKDGLFGRALKHEIDHLNGVLFVDKANPETIYKVEDKSGSIENKSKL